MAAPTLQERLAFYEAAVLGLRSLDGNEATSRRFGADAETRWAQFAGSLGTSDRLDILLGDAAVIWGAAFSPSACFDFFGLADDEPFGPDWGGLDDSAAKRILAGPPEPATLEVLGRKLGVQADPPAIPVMTPSTKLIVAGGAAIVGVAQSFERDNKLSWADQVVVVAQKPAWRQLAGLAAVLLGARARTKLFRPIEDPWIVLRAEGFPQVDAMVISSDAEVEAAEMARKVGSR